MLEAPDLPARAAQVLNAKLLKPPTKVRDVEPVPAVFDQNMLSRLMTSCEIAWDTEDKVLNTVVATN